MRFKTLTFALAVVAVLGFVVGCASYDADRPERTRPQAGGGPHSGLTLTGEVVEVDESSFVVRTTTGDEHVRVMDYTEMDFRPVEGSWVAVDFQRSDEALVAERVQELGTTEREALEAEIGDPDDDAELESGAEHTRPTAEGGPHMGHTLTGEVVRFDDTAVVVRTTTGAEQVQITPRTEMETTLAVGQRVAIDFQRSDDALVATAIRPVSDLDDD